MEVDETGHGSAPVPTRSTPGRGRFAVATSVCLAAVTVPYLWILWDLWTGTISPFRQLSPDNFYDLQARAMMSGHLWLPPGSIGIEAFVHAGRQYTYFGLFPSIIRMPVLLFTHRFDGRLTPLSMLAAWMVTGVVASLLVWRVRVLARGSAPLGWWEAASSGVTVAALTGGSVLMYLAAAPKVSSEDIAWSVALTIGAVLTLLGVVERPSWGRVAAAAGFVLAASIDRSPTGYGCALGALLVAGWFAVRRDRARNRRWVVAMSVVGAGSLAVAAWVNWAKLGTPFGLSEADQVWTHINVHRQRYLAASGGSGFGLRYLPSTLATYLDPTGIHLQSAFPFVTLPTSPARVFGRVIFDETYPTASVTASMPLLFLLGCWGLVTAFRPRPIGRIGTTRILLVAMAAATSGVLLFGYIADRYLGDFLPLLAIAGAIGLVDLWRRLARAKRLARVAATAGVAVLGAFGVWANIGAAITPTALWTNSQSLSFLNAQRRATPAATESMVRVGSRLPYFAPAGELFVVGPCSGLYVSTGISYAVVPQQQAMHETWDPVERGPGILHVAQVVYHRAVRPGDPAVTLLTWGRTTVQLVPAGTDLVRTVVRNPGGSTGSWPPLTTAPQPVMAGVAYQLTVITDPYLQSITVGGLGGGIVHELSGSGPAVVNVSAGASSGTPTVTDVTGPPPSMAVCRALLKGATAAHR